MILDKKTSVVLVDDHRSCLEDALRVLSEFFDIVATASEGMSTIQAIARHEPDVGVGVGGVMSGHWEWFRKDGSIMRSGYLKKGTQAGKWTTYDKTGAVVKVMSFGRYKPLSGSTGHRSCKSKEHKEEYRSLLHTECAVDAGYWWHYMHRGPSYVRRGC